MRRSCAPFQLSTCYLRRFTELRSFRPAAQRDKDAFAAVNGHAETATKPSAPKEAPRATLRSRIEGCGGREARRGADRLATGALLVKESNRRRGFSRLWGSRLRVRRRLTRDAIQALLVGAGGPDNKECNEGEDPHKSEENHVDSL